jgi:hypothetical protein
MIFYEFQSLQLKMKLKKHTEKKLWSIIQIETNEILMLRKNLKKLTKRMIRFEIQQREKIMILFEVHEIFDEGILLDEDINQDEWILKIFFHNLVDDEEILHTLKVLILEIYSEIFDDKQKKHQDKSLQKQNLLI